MPLTLLHALVCVAHLDAFAPALHCRPGSSHSQSGAAQKGHVCACVPMQTCVNREGTRQRPMATAKRLGEACGAIADGDLHLGTKRTGPPR